MGATPAEEPAGRGHVVVTMDRTCETAPVKFPGGRVGTQRLPGQGPDRLTKTLATRVRDTRFIPARPARCAPEPIPTPRGGACPAV